MKNKIFFYLLFILMISCQQKRVPVKNSSITKKQNLPVYGTMTDIDEHVYRTVKIGIQTWMAEDLRVSRYSNGDAILNVGLLRQGDHAIWSNLKTGAYYNLFLDTSGKYGRLYNFNAANDKRGLAPAGWHVPSFNDWQILMDHLGGGKMAGGKLKQKGTTRWHSPNIGATDEVGFNACPAPVCTGYQAVVETHNYFITWWSSTYDWSAGDNTKPGTGVFAPGIIYNSRDINWNVSDPSFGLSVRCVRDD